MLSDAAKYDHISSIATGSTLSLSEDGILCVKLPRLTHIKPFSLWHFSSVFLMTPPSLRKKSCSEGLAVEPGPLV